MSVLVVIIMVVCNNRNVILMLRKWLQAVENAVVQNR